MNSKWLLGYIKGDKTLKEPVYLRGFEWQCGWYWSGGYIGNRNFHGHFDDAFLEVPDIRGHILGHFVTPWTKPDPTFGNGTVISNGCSVWEDLSFFLDFPQYTKNEWWRIKDLFKQFYTLRDAAEVFQCGGHCSASGRTKNEINKPMAKILNQHIEHVIIPTIIGALDKKEVDKKDLLTYDKNS